MKKITLFISLLVSTLSYTQKITFDIAKPNKEPSYEVLSNQKNLKKDTEILLVKPYWRVKDKSSWNIMSSGYSYIPVENKDLEKWKKRILKKDNCSFSKFAFDSTLTIIEYHNSEKLKSENTDNNEAPLNYVMHDKNNLLLYHYYLNNDDSYDAPIELNTFFKNKFGLKATKALTNLNTNLTVNYNGPISVKFYDDFSKNPIAYFQGNIKNGEANGYGLLIKPYYINEMEVVNNRMDENRVLVYSRLGFWEDSQFIEEKNATSMIEKSIDEITKTEMVNYIPQEMKMSYELISAEYNLDPLNPDFSNDFCLRYNLKWEYPSEINNKNNAVFMVFKKTFSDFTEEYPLIDLIKVDDLTSKQLINDADKPLSLSSFISKINEMKWSNQTTSLYDDYTLIKRTPWFESSKVCKYEVVYDENNGNEISRTPVDWTYEKYYDFSISIRKTRDANWQLVDNYRISEVTDCNYNRSIAIEKVQGNEGYKMIESYESGIDYAVKTTKIDHPDPLEDFSKSTFQLKSSEKFDSLIKRVGSSNKFRPNSQLKMIGAWYDPESERIYLIDDLQAQKILCLEKSNSKLFGENGYIKGIQPLYFKFRNENSFIIQAQIDFYSGDDLHLNDYQKNKPNKGTTIHESHTISKIENDIITFDDGVYWLRIKPDDEFIDKIKKENKKIVEIKEKQIKELKSIPKPSAPKSLKVGDNYGGGIVVYIFKPEDKGYLKNEVHGLIVTPVDLSRAIWKDAIYICETSTFNEYTDWRLPTSEELYLIGKSDNIQLNLTGYEYWSSENFGTNQAFQLNRRNGANLITMTKKDNLCYVRGVRNF